MNSPAVMGPGKLCTAARHRLGCSSQGVSLGCRVKHALCLPPRAAETKHSPACKHAGTRFCTGSSNECGSGESAAWYSPSAASTRPVRSCDTASSAGWPRLLSPSSARKEAGMFLTLILLLSGRSLRAMAAQSPQGVECIVFNDQYLTCMWGSKATLTANYSLYYWYIPPRSENHMPVEECKHYLQEEGINTGCWFNHSEIIQFRPFYIHVNASHGGRSLIIPTKVMKLQDLVKPAPPVNLTIQNISNNQLQLTWDSMYLKPLCLEYAVKYKSNQDTSWTEHLVSGKIFSFPSVDYEKYYTFYVKSKINQYCGTTQLWSEWSVPVFWGNNATDQGTAEEQAPWFWIHVVLPIASLMLFLVLVILLIRMERVWVILMPRIPNPSKNFEELFNTHQGNFPEWAGVSKDIVESFKPNYSESFCYVSELPPKEGSTPLWEGRDKLRAPPGRFSAPASSSSPGLSLFKNSYVGV
ncbi:cytokine receptor common subunit gamma isoform X1 [Chelonia mydas]|uniref:cytokine receptor common subunit gamma isoform X1 n=1 Tax=Chelonia mydas TaxID=8469 RepID=UPI001CA8D388|nr:cytokine receptor common subunit gamma isoform X1 [Chelonia mydas]